MNDHYVFIGIYRTSIAQKETVNLEKKTVKIPDVQTQMDLSS